MSLETTPLVVSACAMAVGIALWIRQEVNASSERKRRHAEERKKPAPCGDDETHYHWEHDMDFPCPACCAAERLERERAEERRKARVLANEIARAMQEVGK